LTLVSTVPALTAAIPLSPPELADDSSTLPPPVSLVVPTTRSVSEVVALTAIVPEFATVP